MKTKLKQSNQALVAAALVYAVAPAALAVDPHMGGEMKHVMVWRDGSSLETMIDETVPLPILTNYDETYSGAASVLNGTWYNSQYGWVVEGFWEVPPGASIWIERLSGTPGLSSYSGGTMTTPAFTPIFGTAGSPARIMWDGRMLHNWYAATEPGPYEATYKVYFGDAGGTPLNGYTPSIVTLEWHLYCPADFNHDMFVNGDDYDGFASAFDAADPAADFNGDGFVNGNDYDEFAERFDQGC
ncbi:MAG: hypothetical protein IT434_01275 [Phycisphaerales bacterium]|jgi:hypothetical protein|nr:hypothetical protein [Phycisphaerales bacterium]